MFSLAWYKSKCCFDQSKITTLESVTLKQGNHGQSNQRGNRDFQGKEWWIENDTGVGNRSSIKVALGSYAPIGPVNWVWLTTNQQLLPSFCLNYETTVKFSLLQQIQLSISIFPNYTSKEFPYYKTFIYENDFT